MSRRCLWSNERSDDLREITVPEGSGVGKERTVWVMPEHEEALGRFLAYARRWGRTFLLAVVGLPLLVTPVAVLLDAPWLASVMVAAIGVLVIIFPFATPQTVEMMGVRNSIRLARVLGLLTIALAMWMFWSTP